MYTRTKSSQVIKLPFTAQSLLLFPMCVCIKSPGHSVKT